jgi:cytochrome c
MTKHGIAVALLAISLQAGAASAADVAKGREQFRKCEACHALESGVTKIGPHLAGLFGRKAGTVDGFAYSTALKNSGIVWEEKTLDEYVASPSKMVKGGKMVFAGIAKPEDRENLIAFLKDATKPKP